MAEVRRLDGTLHPPTWAERVRMENLRREGIEDVYVEPEDAPPQFWAVLLQGVHRWLAAPNSFGMWNAWAAEVNAVTGWQVRTESHTLTTLLLEGKVDIRYGDYYVEESVDVGWRLGAVEFLIDVVSDGSGDVTAFAEFVNDRARWFRVGLRLEGTRFVPVTSEHLHQTVVRPALLLLADPELAAVDELYRKGFERALSNDPGGAVAAAITAVEKMLKVGLGVDRGDLNVLTAKARDAGWISPSVKETANKLMALREESDVHDEGTDDDEVAMYALHIAGATLVHLARTRPEM